MKQTTHRRELNNPITAFALAVAILIAPAFAAAEVTLHSLIEEMIDYDAVARWPQPEFTCKQASSYDRKRVAPDKPDWFANHDQGQYIREENNDGRKENVMLDADGPGCIVRFWLTAGKSRNGTLRIYLDGAPTPTLVFPAYDLLSGTLNIGEPLALPHPGYDPKANGGNTLMLPIPYAKHCKVTWEEASSGGRYYQINYRTYTPGTAVQTFTLEALGAARPLMAKVGKALFAPTENMSGKSLSLNETIAAGKNASLDLTAGPAAVRLLELHVGVSDSAELERTLRSTIVQMQFDGEVTVWCPASDFFGSGVGINALSSWYRTVHTNGTMLCRWVMPYKKSGRITVANIGERPMKMTMRAVTSSWNWDDRSMHFHSAWHYEADMQTPPHRDWNYVRIAGRGVYVGDTLSLFNPIATWYGEGDEKIWVDGESFPSHMGTGTEDYYNYSYAPRGIIQTPFANQVRVDEKMTQGHNVLTRTRNLDGIPFTKSLNFDMELMPWKPMKVTYAATTHWYAFPGATSNVKPQPKEAALPVPTLAQAIVAAVRPDVMIADFRKTPLPEGWNVEGYAFGSRTRGSGFQQAAVTTENQRQYQFGKITSPEFTLERNFIAMELGGTFHPEKCFVVLKIDGKEVRRAWGGQLSKEWTSLNVDKFAGQKATLEVRDDHFNGWLSVGQVIQTDELKGSAQKRAPRWNAAIFETQIKGDYLLLPIGDEKSPIETVSIEIDGKQKLAIDVPLAMSPTTNMLPVYDLRGYQGETLRVSYHETRRDIVTKQIQVTTIPAHAASDALPAFHVHNRFGKLNDPNGLVYLGGQYHLFHQYFMGMRGKLWAHYVSPDLMHWQEQPIALFPDELGSMHSGSAAVDWLNTGGFQQGDQPAIIAAFTGSRGLGGKDKIQLQAIAYSTDGGRNFAKYGGNPVIGEAHLKKLNSKDSRDPKIFWFSPTRGLDAKAKDGFWVMVLFEGKGLSFFNSHDLKTWEKRGSLPGFFECPDLFPLAVDGNPQNVRWVIHGGNGEYHIGAFDGQSFKSESEKKIKFNHGGRYYAAQTFNNTLGEMPRRIQVGWQGNQLSVPNELTLRTTPIGLRMCVLPVKEIANLYQRSESFDGQVLREGDANLLKQFKSGRYDIEFDGRVGGAKQIEFTVRGKVIRYAVSERELSCESFKVTLPANEGRLKLRVVVDNCSIDIYVGDGGQYFIPMFFDPLKSKELELRVLGGTIKLEGLSVHELKSIWSNEQKTN